MNTFGLVDEPGKIMVGMTTNGPKLEVSGKTEWKAGKVQKWIGRAEKVVGESGRINTGSQNTKEGTMSQTVLERTAEHIAESAHQASRATTAVGDAIEDGVGVVTRAAKQGGDAAEEFLNDTTQRIQRHPVLTAATTFAVGLTAGTLIGWMMKRR